MNVMLDRLFVSRMSAALLCCDVFSEITSITELSPALPFIDEGTIQSMLARVSETVSCQSDSEMTISFSSDVGAVPI